MGQKRNDGKDEPTLELPSLFGRQKNKAAKPAGRNEADAPDKPAYDEAGSAEATQPTEPTEPIQPEPAETATVQSTQADERPEPASAPEPEEGDAGFGLPAIPARAAAVVTGVVVGAVGTGLTYLAMLGCEAVKGTSSCGRPGFFLLVAIVLLMILLGAGILKAWKLSAPGSTSFLAVGILIVVVMVALLDIVFSAWMFLLVPVIGAASYVLSHWVTSRFSEEQETTPSYDHDVR